jgi:hypothetical protein
MCPKFSDSTTYIFISSFWRIVEYCFEFCKNIIYPFSSASLLLSVYFYLIVYSEITCSMKVLFRSVIKVYSSTRIASWFHTPAVLRWRKKHWVGRKALRTHNRGGCVDLKDTLNSVVKGRISTCSGYHTLSYRL